MDSGMPHRTPSRRERLKRQRESKILEAAAAVFARKGYHQATIREIAELADVADGTVYNYYASKRDLLIAMARHVIADSASNALAEFHADDDRAFLSAILSERFAFAERNSDFVRALLAEVMTDEEFRQHYLGQVMSPFLQSLEGYLQARIDAGTLRPVNARIAVRAMVASFLAFLLPSRSGYGLLGVDLTPEEVVSELVDLFLVGLQAQPEGGKA